MAGSVAICTVRGAAAWEAVAALGMKDNPGVQTPMATEPESLTSPLLARVREAIAEAGGWLPFDRFMAIALYEPGLGYYAGAAPKFGQMPQGGSDFVTAPELTPLFGRTLARQVAQALQATQTRQVWEFGAGSGALALQVIEGLQAQGLSIDRYTIVDLSGRLRERQRSTLAAHAGLLHWADALPDAIEGVVLGNEVLDAMPVQLLAREDFAQHYTLSTLLSLMVGGRVADTVGLYKEMADADKGLGGSGFSFNDLVMNRAGIRLGQRARQDPVALLHRLGGEAALLSDRDFVPQVDGLPEFLNRPEFIRRFGGLNDARFRQVLDAMDQTLAGLPVLR